jgi:hypothetical protein
MRQSTAALRVACQVRQASEEGRDALTEGHLGSMVLSLLR